MNLITFDLPKTSVLGVPHLFSKVDPQKKVLLEKRYKILKRRIIVKKVSIKFHMIVYSYKSFLVLVLSPYLGIVAVVLNLISKTERIKNTAFLISQISGMIIKHEVRLMDMEWIFVDLSLFGKMVPCYEGINYSLLHNVITIDPCS